MEEFRAACPFCSLPPLRVRVERPVGFVVEDAYPLARGHLLVVPRLHVESLFALPPEDLAAIWKLVAEARELLVEEHHPDGVNIGVNDGAAAGQTVAHAHVHLIPRRHGDVPDPRGGIRWVIPGRARYWKDES